MTDRGAEKLTPEQENRLFESLQQCMRLVCASLPHLAGLAHAVKLELSRRIPTAAIFASGRMLANPEFFAELDRSESTFVLAHELMHLALHTHQRSEGADPLIVNYAHDYIINDILSQELGREVPAGGLVMEGAREESLERLVQKLKGDPQNMPGSVWARGQGSRAGGGSSRADETLSELGKVLRDAMKQAGVAPDLPEPQAPPQETPAEPPMPGDVLNDLQEREWFPDARPEEIRQKANQIRKLAARANSLGVWRDKLKDLQQQQDRGFDPGNSESMVTALRGSYLPPWDIALQRWMDAVSPGPRTYARPSRRGADREDVVLPGRKREGWTLHILLDTSGSMSDDIPRALGVIADYCEASGVDQVRLLQCDTAITSDEMVSPQDLAEYRVLGYGGSDMSPAMNHLAEDPEVEAMVVITDGYIDYPESVPYHVLWVLPQWRSADSFSPRYGHVIQMR